MKNKKKIIVITGVIVLVAMIGLRLASNKKTINALNKPVDRSQITVPVNVSIVAIGPVETSFVLPAVVKPMNEANLSLSASGKVKFLSFDVGTRVSKGQMIGSLDNSLKQINLEAAQLLVEKAEVDYHRLKDLYEGKAATEVDYNNARYTYENAKNQVAQFRQQIADANMISPVSGIVTKKNVEEGEFVNMGVAIATIVDISTLKAVVMVSEKDVYRLKEGLPVTITSDVYPDKEFKGDIRFISPAGDESHTYEVEVTVHNESKLEIKAGTFVKVRFDIKGSTEALQIPKLALVEGIKDPYVYVTTGNRTAVKKVTLGRDLGDQVEILSGLNVGDSVITSGHINLTEQSIIEVINTSKQ